jgi:hypothetical protein
MKSTLTTAVLILVFVGMIVGFSLIVRKQGERTSLTLEISSQGSKYQLGVKIPVLVHITNTGYFNVDINRRMVVNFSGSPNSLRDVTFIIKKPSGETIPFLARVNVRPVREEAVITLAPGETVSKAYDLGELYDLSQTGFYEITAIYQNPSEIGENDKVWKGELKSNTLIIEITS